MGKTFLIRSFFIVLPIVSKLQPARGAQGLDQMRWDQASRGSFGHVSKKIDGELDSKKIDSP